MSKKVKARVAHWYGLYDSKGHLYNVEREYTSFPRTTPTDAKRSVTIVPTAEYRRLKAIERRKT